ncbi:GNAT family protein [Nostoc sp. NMS8]|uniref:GNAT family N-acetyltransferase n=1 Tax=Nostoc sp. NMS8 TaxID=2815392 RepID=UPI0025D2C2CA|nr:GNAT family protein [Nostoc sp. NMS8]
MEKDIKNYCIPAEYNRIFLMIKLRSANLNDIDFILTQENRDEFKDLIICWSREEHSRNLHFADKHYLMIENSSGETQGYAILSGLQSPNKSIELTRIIIAAPGRGYGKRALRIILKKVFEEYNAHRFWLDVFEHNQRARHVYQSVGFQNEGVLREALRQKDKYYSLVIMSILENQYFH